MRHTGLKGNPVYLERILTAVADNAVKFTEPGGCVQVWCVEKKQIMTMWYMNLPVLIMGLA